VKITKNKSMIYAIKILTDVIKTHNEAIKELNDMEHEMVSSIIFADEEIKEREGYIKQLTEAIEKLSKTN